MAAGTKKPSGKRDETRNRSSWRIVSGVPLGKLLLGAVVVGAGGWAIAHWLLPSHPSAADVAIIEPPAVNLSGIDPAVIRAIEQARAAVKESPRSPQAWGVLGNTLLAHEFHIPGSVCLAQAERLDPTSARWPYLEGAALAVADPPDPIAAIEAFQRAVALGGDRPDTLRLRLGEALLGQDRLDEAEQQFQRILRLEPGNARAHLGLARVAGQRGNAQESERQLQHALTDPHAKKASRLLMLEVQQRLGKEPAAEEAQTVAALPQDPPWPDLYWEEASSLRVGMKAGLYRAEGLLRQGRTAEAIPLLQRTAKDYPDSYYVWLTLGRTLTKQRNLKAAEQTLRTALKLAPDSAEVQFYLGVSLSLQGNYRAAEEQFRAATESKPNFATAHYNFAYCLWHKGDKAGAMEAFRTAVRCKYDYADAHTMLSKLLAEDGRHAEAFAHARLALQFHPADATAKNLVQQLLIHIPFTAGL
jgi:tetratricopeptide (TPR) repeat protein